MCIGIPVRVLDQADGFGTCVRFDGTPLPEPVDLRIVGAVATGGWVLAFNGAARRVLDAEEARQTHDALQALEIALSAGNTADPSRFDHLFADLIDREPQLPPHLRAPR